MDVLERKEEKKDKRESCLRPLDVRALDRRSSRRLRDSGKTRLLRDVILSGCPEAVFVMLHFDECRADESDPRVGEAPIFLAARVGITCVFLLLLKRTQNVVNGLVSESGESLLYAAARRGNIGIVKQLLRRGADVNHRHAYTGNSPLHAAAMCGSLEIVRLLLDHGAHVDGASKKGFTALHVAVVSDWLQIAQLLLVRGADCNAASITGIRPVECARTIAMNRLLMSRTNSVGDLDRVRRPRTPRNRIETVRHMIDLGSNPRMFDNVVLDKDINGVKRSNSL